MPTPPSGRRRCARWSARRDRAPKSSTSRHLAPSSVPTPDRGLSASSGSTTAEASLAMPTSGLASLLVCPSEMTDRHDDTTKPRRRGSYTGRVPTTFAGGEAPGAWPRLPATPRPDSLERPVSTLRGVGPTLQKTLGKLGLRTIEDLLEHRPHRYETAVPERRIADLLAGEEAAIAGEVTRVSVRRPRRNLAIVQARVADESGEIGAVWFNQAWLAEKLQPGTRVRLRGQLERNGFKVRSYDLNGVSATADFAPVYPASEEVTPKRLRGL